MRVGGSVPPHSGGEAPSHEGDAVGSGRVASTGDGRVAEPRPVRDGAAHSAGDSASGLETDVGFRGVDAVLNSLRLRLKSMDQGSTQRKTLYFLAGQVRRARDYVNPHRMPNYEGILFGDLLNIPTDYAPALGDAYCLLLIELGCHITHSEAQRVKGVLVSMVSENRATAKEMLPPDADETGEEYAQFEEFQTDLYFRFLDEMREAIDHEDFLRLSRHLRDLSFRVAQ